MGKCGKCNGTGKIVGYMHRDNGKCYTCYGSGQVQGIQVSLVGKLSHIGDIVSEALLNDDQNRAEFYANLCAREMFEAGTDTARAALNQIADGRFDTDEGFQVRPDLGQAAAKLIIAKGHEQKAAR